MVGKKLAEKSGGYSGLGAESVSAAEIAKHVAPPLDERVSRRIQSMLDVRGTGNGLITSRGDRMVFTINVTGTPQVWRQDGAMKFAVQLTGGEDRTGAVGLAPDDSFIVLSRDIGGAENPGLYLMSLDGGALRPVQHLPKIQTALQFISDDSKSLYFRSNDIVQDSYAIYRYDIKAGKRELVFDQKGLWSVADHRGDSWLMTKALGSTQIEVYEYNLKSKQLTPLLGQHEQEE